MTPPLRRSLIAIAVAAVVLIGAVLASTRAAHARDALIRADPDAILDDPALARTALRIGRDGFVAHCAGCHGTGAGDPARGIPDLTDRDFLFGDGGVAQIEQIILHGIRSGDPRGWNLASMPVYASARPYPADAIPPLRPGDVADVVRFLEARHGIAGDDAAAARGRAIFAGRGGCWDCHGNDGGGDPAIGAPNLLDDVWLYGSTPAAIARSIADGRAGVSPAFARTLSAGEARAIAVYVAALARPGIDGVRR